MYVLIVPYPAPNVKQASLRVSILRGPHVRRRAKIAPYNLYSHSARNMRKAADSAVRKAESAASRAKETPRPASGLHVVVELELLAVAALPAAMPLSGESVGRWFASFSGVDRYQPAQGRNRKTGSGAGMSLTVATAWCSSSTDLTGDPLDRTAGAQDDRTTSAARGRCLRSCAPAVGRPRCCASCCTELTLKCHRIRTARLRETRRTSVHR